VFDDAGAEDRLPEPRRPVDPQQLWSRGDLYREPMPESRLAEYPVASAVDPLLEGVVVAFVWRAAAEPGVEFPSRLGSAALARG
jgi:hypothetical protein